MGTTHANILLHCVFSTKHIKPYIVPEIEVQLYEYIGGVVRNKNAVLYKIGGTENHVHMYVRWNTASGIGELLRDVKSESSKWVHQTFKNRQEFSWQTGYAVFSVSQSQATKVNRYIDQQREHHDSQSFQDELRQLLGAHNIEFDEEYLWD